MAHTHTYSIVDLKRNTSTGLVTKVCWQLETTDSNGNNWLYTDEFLLSGSETDPGFIQYNNLTEENVLGWLDSNIDKSAVESFVEGLLANSLLTNKGVPWTT
jgi:hypothetical protein